MVQGTASSVGKSFLVTALCRLLARQGVRVAPFKSQNMALNAAVTADGGEVGRAQATQAEAAGIAVTVDMNPVLLKPEGESRAQVVVLGRPWARAHAGGYRALRGELAPVIAGALQRLRAQFEVVVIEGAGSPAEINLKDGELVNMHVARLADAPVLLAADIDRGGVFASLVGTMELLEADERARVAGFVINKFRGDRRLLEPGLEWLTRRTGVPVLGVVPFLPRLRLADEDSVSLDDKRRRRRPPLSEIDVAVVCLPRLSNQDDFDPLEHEPGVTVRFVESAEELAGADLVVLPGSKTTLADLAWLRARGLDGVIVARAECGLPVLGICGGCQMLGEEILDPQGVEAQTVDPVAGLGLLPLRTRFGAGKRTAQVAAIAGKASFLSDGVSGAVAGYEIHAGEVEPASTLTAGARAPALVITSRSGAPCRIEDGAVSASGAVVGTMVHGLLADDGVRGSLLDHLRRRRGLPLPRARPRWDRMAEYDRLADEVGAHLALDQVLALVRPG
jgi:adenosylcobyric acid synthase